MRDKSRNKTMQKRCIIVSSGFIAIQGYQPEVAPRGEGAGPPSAQWLSDPHTHVTPGRSPNPQTLAASHVGRVPIIRSRQRVHTCEGALKTKVLSKHELCYRHLRPSVLLLARELDVSVLMSPFSSDGAVYCTRSCSDCIRHLRYTLSQPRKPRS